MCIFISIKKKFDNLEINANLIVNRSLTVFYGPSGAGKSSILNIIAGLIKADEGLIKLDEKVLFCSSNSINIPINLRKIGYIFQQHELFPHFTVFENIAYGLKKYSKSINYYQSINDLVVRFNLENIVNKYPSEISGGQQQKVIFARTIINNPSVLLLDEPFSALDIQSRIDMRKNLKIVQNILNIPTILVTHDIYEAYAIADKILYIVGGNIVHEELITE